MIIILKNIKTKIGLVKDIKIRSNILEVNEDNMTKINALYINYISEDFYDIIININLMKKRNE